LVWARRRASCSSANFVWILLASSVSIAVILAAKISLISEILLLALHCGHSFDVRSHCSMQLKIGSDQLVDVVQNQTHLRPYKCPHAREHILCAPSLIQGSRQIVQKKCFRGNEQRR
jgi:hypothetical protein